MEADEFDAFYAISFSRLVNQLYAIIGDRDEAQDCVQEAFARAWSHRRKLDSSGSPEAWVRLTAYRLAVQQPDEPIRRERITRAVSCIAGDLHRVARAQCLFVARMENRNFRRALGQLHVQHFGLRSEEPVVRVQANAYTSCRQAGQRQHHPAALQTDGEAVPVLATIVGPLRRD